MLDKTGNFYYVDCENWDKNNKRKEYIAGQGNTWSVDWRSPEHHSAGYQAQTLVSQR